MTGLALRLGTRGSPLAVWQAEWVERQLRAHGHGLELIRIATTGDRITDVPLSSFGVPAVFSRELDEALLDGRIDLAVHSLKDLPTVLPDGIALAAVSRREDPRDALVGRGPLAWRDLAPGAVVATSSLRRRAQLLRARPDLEIVDLRGNVGTRLEKLQTEARWGGIVLAVAGLARLGLQARIGERLPLDLIVPAPGQGVLAVTVRADDPRTAEAVRRPVEDEESRLAITAERAVLRALEGGCQVPFGAHAAVVPRGASRAIVIHGRVLSLDGRTMVERILEQRLPTSDTDGDVADAVGATLARDLIAEGADRILAAVRPATRSNALSGQPQ